MKDKNICACCVSWLCLRSYAGKTHMNGGAAIPKSFGMLNHSTSDNTSRPNSSEYQLSTDDSMKSGPRTVERECRGQVDRLGFMHRSAPGMIWGMFPGLSFRLLPISMYLSLGFCAWYGFSRSSFSFKIWWSGEPFLSKSSVVSLIDVDQTSSLMGASTVASVSRCPNTRNTTR